MHRKDFLFKLKLFFFVGQLFVKVFVNCFLDGVEEFLCHLESFFLKLELFLFNGSDFFLHLPPFGRQCLDFSKGFFVSIKIGLGLAQMFSLVVKRSLNLLVLRNNLIVRSARFLQELKFLLAQCDNVLELFKLFVGFGRRCCLGFCCGCSLIVAALTQSFDVRIPVSFLLLQLLQCRVVFCLVCL